MRLAASSHQNWSSKPSFAHRDYQGFKVQTAALVAHIREGSSHAADAFGLMAISYEDPARVARFNRKLVYAPKGIVWLRQTGLVLNARLTIHLVAAPERDKYRLR
jgi:hypothetical protein